MIHQSFPVNKSLSLTCYFHLYLIGNIAQPLFLLQYSGLSCLKISDRIWYFFCPKERKYGRGDRAKRSTRGGFWKTTGQDRTVLDNDKCVGMIKTLIFHEGRASNGSRTDWVMHEYSLQDPDLAAQGIPQVLFNFSLSKK